MKQSNSAWPLTIIGVSLIAAAVILVITGHGVVVGVVVAIVFMLM